MNDEVRTTMEHGVSLGIHAVGYDITYSYTGYLRIGRNCVPVN